MWIVYALASAVFAGATSILAKVGIRDCDSHVVTALRTGVVLVFSWLMVLITGAQAGLAELTGRTVLFLTLSGLATGASWLCYFKALQLGPEILLMCLTMRLAAVFRHRLFTHRMRRNRND